jgi:hypothetical protein|tara:strand:+ start:396 stop:497 length:102 start_codon:yes stop_codon:yes gene_type:complete
MKHQNDPEFKQVMMAMNQKQASEFARLGLTPSR